MSCSQAAGIRCSARSSERRRFRMKRYGERLVKDFPTLSPLTPMVALPMATTRIGLGLYALNPNAADPYDGELRAGAVRPESAAYPRQPGVLWSEAGWRGPYLPQQPALSPAGSHVRRFGGPVRCAPPQSRRSPPGPPFASGSRPAA